MTTAFAPIIVIEGADGTGKTTLAHNLAATLGPQEVVLIHNGADDAQLPGSLYRHYLAQFMDAVDRADRGIATIIDRSFLSEVIYGRLYRGKARLTERQAHRLERYARRHGIALHGQIADLDTRRRRIRERGETFDPKQPFVGAFYSQWFSERAAYWSIADSTSATNL